MQETPAMFADLEYAAPSLVTPEEYAHLHLRHRRVTFAKRVLNVHVAETIPLLLVPLKVREIRCCTGNNEELLQPPYESSLVCAASCSQLLTVLNFAKKKISPALCPRAPAFSPCSYGMKKV